MSVLAASRCEVLEQLLAAAEDTGRCLVEVDVRELRTLLEYQRLFSGPTEQLEALGAIVMERARQEDKGRERRALGEAQWLSCATVELEDGRKLAILTEEVGEVAKAINEAAIGNDTNMREELVHVAACAVAWLESLP